MTKYYWYKICPACQQGRLVITKNTSQDKLYLHCDECEMGWPTPGDADANINGFLTLLEEYDAEAPSIDEIESCDWLTFVSASFELP